MQRRKSFLTGLTLAALLLVGWIPAPVRAEAIKIGGTGFGLGVLQILGKAFEKSHPGVIIDVIPSLGSSGGISALLQGSLDIAVSGRPLDEAETKKGGVAEELARTPFVFIVNLSVRKEGVSTRELEEIYSGRKLTWSDGTRLRLVLRPETETDTKIVRGLSPAMGRAMTSAQAREGMIRAVTDQENAHMLESTPGAVGGGTLTQMYSEKRHVKILPINGVVPSVEGMRDGSYSLAKSLYLVTMTKSPPAARNFVKFIHSEEGGRILAKYGNLIVDGRKSPAP